METKELEGRKILIIEDDELISRVYVKWLKNAGAEVTITHDGVQGLEVLDKNTVDIVLLDLGMPGMNGYDTLKALRAREDGKNMPVIVLSNTVMSENEEGFAEIKEAGVTHVLSKYETSLKEIVQYISAYFPKNQPLTN